MKKWVFRRELKVYRVKKEKEKKSWGPESLSVFWSTLGVLYYSKYSINRVFYKQAFFGDCLSPAASLTLRNVSDPWRWMSCFGRSTWGASQQSAVGGRSDPLFQSVHFVTEVSASFSVSKLESVQWRVDYILSSSALKVCLIVLIDDVVSYLNFMPSQLWRSYYGRTPFIKSQFRFQFTVYSTSGKENEVKWTWNAELAQAKLLAAGETHKATFWPTPGLTESTFITVLDSEHGGLTFCVWNSAPWKYSEEWDWRNLLGHTEKSVMAQNSQHIWKKMYFENIFVCCFTGYSGDP